MFSDKKYREVLNLLERLEGRISGLESRLELLADATGHVYVLPRRATVPPACYAPKDSELAKEFLATTTPRIRAWEDLRNSLKDSLP